MATEFRIHVLTDVFTKEHLAAMCSNHLGSKYDDPDPFGRAKEKFEIEHNCSLYDLALKTPYVLMGSGPGMNPHNAIDVVADLIGEDLPVIDDALIAKIEEALHAKDENPYWTLTPFDEVMAFLEQYKGERVFTILW